MAFGQLLVPDTILYSPHSDALVFHAASKSVARSALGRGELPHWRSDQLSGYPALANPQALYFHPLHLAFWLLPFDQALGITFFVHFLLAGVGFFLLGRALHLGPLARLLMGSAGMLSFKLILVAYAGWLSVVSSLVLLPFVFAALLWLLESRRPAAALALATSLGLALASGQLQLVYYALLLAPIWIVSALWRGGDIEQAQASPPDARPPRRLRTVALLAAAGILAAGFAAHSLWPLALDAPLLSRAAGLPSFADQHTLGLASAATFLYPEALGTPLDGSYSPLALWEDVAYFGVVPLLLALAALLWGRRQRRVQLLALGVALTLLLATAGPWLEALAAVVPGFELFRHPSRWLFLTALLALCLAGIGLDLVGQALKRRGLAQRRLLLLGVAAVGLVGVEGVVYARRYLQTRPTNEALPKPTIAGDLARARKARPFRVAALGRQTLNAAQLGPAGIELVSGFDSTNLRHYQRYLGLLETGKLSPVKATSWLELRRIARPELLALLDVRRLVTAAPLPGSALGSPKVYRDQPLFVLTQGVSRRTLYVYDTEGLSPRRAAFVPRTLRVQSAEAMAREVARRDLRRLAVVLGPVKHTDSSGRGEVDQLETTPGSVRLRAKSPRGGFLLLGEIWHPGWQARVDGTVTPLLRANLALMGLDLPPGEHRVELRFNTPGWALGATLSALSLLMIMLAGVALVVSGRRSRRARPRQPDSEVPS